MIEIRALAKYFEEHLGTQDYVIEPSSFEFLQDDDDKRTPGTLQVNRIPFAIEGVDCETMNIVLALAPVINTTLQKDKVMSDVKKLLGYVSGVVIQNYEDTNGNIKDTVTYKVKSFLELTRPINPPSLGADMRTEYTLQGSLLVSKVGSGALMSNDVETYIYDRNPSQGGAVGGGVAVLACMTDLNKTVDAPMKVNTYKAVPNTLAQSTSYGLQLLYLGSPIEKILIQHINLLGTEYALNRTYWLKRVIPTTDSTVEVLKEVQLVAGKLTEQAGAFAQYSITLQEV